MWYFTGTNTVPKCIFLCIQKNTAYSTVDARCSHVGLWCRVCWGSLKFPSWKSEFMRHSKIKISNWEFGDSDCMKDCTINTFHQCVLRLSSLKYVPWKHKSPWFNSRGEFVLRVILLALLPKHICLPLHWIQWDFCHSTSAKKWKPPQSKIIIIVI